MGKPPSVGQVMNVHFFNKDSKSLLDIAVEMVLDCAPGIKTSMPQLELEPVVSELGRGLEGLKPQYPARVHPLFGAVHWLATEVNEGRFSSVEVCYAECGQRWGAISRAWGRTGGGEGSGEWVKWRG